MAITAIQNEDGTFTLSGRAYNITEEKNKTLEPFGKQVQNDGCILRILPTTNQQTLVKQQNGCARVVANVYKTAKEENNKKRKEENNNKDTKDIKNSKDVKDVKDVKDTKDSENSKEVKENNNSILTLNKYKKEVLPTLKKEKPYLKECDKFVIESALEHMDGSFNGYYKALSEGEVKVIESGRRKGQHTHYPRFVSKYDDNGNCYTTKYTNNNIKLEEVNGKPYIKLPKLGYVEVVLPKGKTIEDIMKGSRILSVVVRRHNYNSENDDWYTVSLQLERIIDKIETITEVKKQNIIASDMGIKDFAIYGNEEYVEKAPNPRWVKTHERRIALLQKQLARQQYDVETKKGSKNYYKTKEKLRKEHAKLKNQRKDFQHKLSREIVDKCDVFICEDLNIQGMMKNHKLAKEIGSVGWSQFLTFVKYKLERKGGIFIKVDRFFASSKLCSKCGHKNTELILKVREWKCPSCGTLHDRDGNAKNNLLNEGIRILKEEYKVNVI